MSGSHRSTRKEIGIWSARTARHADEHDRTFRVLCQNTYAWHVDANVLDLLENKLYLDRTNLSVGEAGSDLEDRFLCATIEDGDLPWDTKERDG